MKKISVNGLLKKTWNYLSSKKTVIGFILIGTAKGLESFAPNLIPSAQVEFIEYLGIGIGSLGVTHKGFKNPYIQEKMKPLMKFTGSFNNKN